MPNCTVSMEVQDLDFAVTEKGDRNCSRFTAAAECFYSTVFGLFRPPFSKSQGAGVSVFQQISGFLKRSSRSAKVKVY